jgi:U3 small nucleolar RNA-associated protein MPP10
LPTASATSTLLAPEELLAPAKSLSALRDRSELTPAEKRAARSKERKKRKKAAEAVKSYVSNRGGKNKTASAKKEKDDALRSLVKSGRGVTVVGKDSANLKHAVASNGKGVKPGETANRREKLTSANVNGSRWKL